MKRSHRPPPILEYLLKKVVLPYDRESLLGDFQEVYQYTVDASGRPYAVSWYLFHLLKLVPSFLSNTLEWSVVMFRSNVKFAFRAMRHHKGYSFINITGLAVGIACCLLILAYVQDELSYDRYHQKADQIYRVTLDATIGGQELALPMAPTPMGEVLVQDFPEVLASTRIYGQYFGTGSFLIQHEDKRFKERQAYLVDSTFFDVFTVRFLQGDPAVALTDPGSMVITESTALKYFGSDDPIGKTLTMVDLNNLAFQVSGVVADPPHNSHFQYDFLGSILPLPVIQNPAWSGSSFLTYIVLQEGSSPDALEAKLPEVIAKYQAPAMAKYLNRPQQKNAASKNRVEYKLQALTDIHLGRNYQIDLSPHGSMTYIYTFSAIAVFILLIACINFVNLVTARGAGRAKEVGIRKVMGSFRSQLIGQFLIESTALSVIALLLALAMVALVLPGFNDLAAKELSINFFSNGLLLSSLVGFVLFVGLMAGSYPAFFLSSFRPVVVLKGNVQAGTKRSGLRGGLVVFQFAISMILIVGTLVVFQQIEYLQSENLGFDKEHVVVISRAQTLGGQREAFKQELIQNPNILHAAASGSIPGKRFSNRPFQNPEQEETVSYWYLPVDHDWIETYRVEITHGRSFSKDRVADSLALLLNEEAAAGFGWTPEEAIGKQIVAFLGRQGATHTVIGMVKDFNFESLHREIRPLVIGIGGARYMSVRIRPNDVPGTLAYLEDQWETFVADQPFEYSFLDEDFDALYRAEQRTGKLVGVFATLAILIACLGLFGLASFVTEQRTKEIGVRKVLGASVSRVVLLLSLEFTRLVGIGFIVAAPIAYFVMNRWLQDFSYRTELGIGVFVIAGVLALAIAWLTVSYQSIRAAVANPVNALRHE